MVNATGDVVIEFADEGTDTIRSSVTWTLGANLENLVLTGTSGLSATGNALDNVLTGNAGANTLTGGAGSDVLDGGVGSDKLIGGSGDDRYLVDSTGDTVTELADEGDDTVESKVTYVLPANVERLILTGSAAINGTGNALGNEILGNAAANVLNGGAGADTLRGGAGNDTYVVDTTAEVVVELADEGIDLVQASVSWTLGEHVESLTLTGTAAIDGTGNTLDNVLTGNSAANVLIGGKGNDTYVVDHVGDSVVELADEGVDLVLASIAWTLGDYVENLTLTGAAAIQGTGNALANVLLGNTANNTLIGGEGDDTLDGGAGNDTLVGGAGDDTYTVNATGDVVTEHPDGGTDLVRSSVTWTLGANLENLLLIGTAKINGTGNAADNRLTGNAAANVLTGGAGNDILDGGAGADTMSGGIGDDSYVVDATSDKVVENANEGTDSVQSSVTWTLPANVEHLALTGSASINGTGNALSNLLRGNGGANVLNGGAGNDVVQGGDGNDTLTDSSGNSVLDGGDGADVLTGGTGREFLAGGTGNDTLTLGGGADLIAFNRGHGADSVSAPTPSTGLNEANDTITLGGVRYDDLRLARTGNDLFINVAGTGDSLKFTNWYAATGNGTVATLQMVVDSSDNYDASSADPLFNHRVAWFDFAALVGAFNTALASDPSLGDWAIPDATLGVALIAGSNTHALGGDLAYHYGRDGALGALDFATATAVIGDATFGVSPQAFGPVAAPSGIRLLDETTGAKAMHFVGEAPEMLTVVGSSAGADLVGPLFL